MDESFDGYLSAVILAGHQRWISESTSHSETEAVVGPSPSRLENMLFSVKPTRQHKDNRLDVLTPKRKHSFIYMFKKM